ncbi:hypothetical protein L6164_012130 [Bauhinia variegata]|uniref:Uncharacterized protein n=1 Tax=Bauhinia variegata TaxID=167791 RepID=A0ACB9PC02_BAUVA|nr:hypothetical protein L6164_012130 [Bauhinia variegata]
MRCHGLAAISGSENRFLCLPAANPKPFSFSAHRSKPLKFPSRIGFVSLRAKAAVNDGFVTAAPAELSFYELLGISESGSLPEIKQAYKQLARKYHPDVSPPDRVEEYTKRFIQVQEAYETLSDPRRRAIYDRDMASGLHLAFSARRRYYDDEVIEQRSEWKNRWQSQLSELKRKSKYKDAGGNMSWASRMRRRREEQQSD